MFLTGQSVFRTGLGKVGTPLADRALRPAAVSSVCRGRSAVLDARLKRIGLTMILGNPHCSIGSRAARS